MCVLVYLPVSRILPVSFAHTLCLIYFPSLNYCLTSGKTMWDCLTMKTAPSSFSHITRNHLSALAINIRSSTDSVNIFFLPDSWVSFIAVCKDIFLSLSLSLSLSQHSTAHVHNEC